MARHTLQLMTEQLVSVEEARPSCSELSSVQVLGRLDGDAVAEELSMPLGLVIEEVTEAGLGQHIPTVCVTQRTV